MSSGLYLPTRRIDPVGMTVLAQLPRPPWGGVTTFVLARNEGEAGAPAWVQVDVCPTRVDGLWMTLGSGAQIAPEAIPDAIAALERARELLNQ